MTIPDAVDQFRQQANDVGDEEVAAQLRDIASLIENEHFEDAKREVRALPVPERMLIDEEVWDWLMEDEVV